MCGFTDPLSCPGEWAGNAAEGAVSAVAGSALEKLAEGVSTAVGDGLAALGTLWVNVGTPNLAEGTSTGRNAGATPPGAAAIDQVLSYMLYLGLGVCILSLMVAGARMAMPHRYSQGEGEEAARVGTVLMATVVISAASALIGGLFRGGRSGQAGDTVAFLQNSLWYYALALAMVSIIVAGIKMAWDQKAHEGRDVVKSILTLLLVTGAGLPVLGLLVEASDAFSEWIIKAAIDCDPTVNDGACFKRNITSMIAIGSASTGGVGAPFMVIVLGSVAVLTSLAQIALMVARAGMLVILAGILPLTAAATNTEMGGMWFKRALGWLIAWLLYKPAAAIVYATAFHLSGSDIFTDDSTGIVQVAAGLMLMLMAIVALPALMRFVTPAVGSMAAGAGGGMMVAAAATPAMGALSAAGRMGAGGADQSYNSPSSPDAASSPSAVGANSSGSSDGGGFSDGQQGTRGPSGSQGASPAASAGGSGTGAGTGGAAAGGGAAGGAGGGAAAGGAAAAAGPAGLAVMAADGAKQAGQAAAGAAQSTADGAAKSEGGDA